MIPQLAAALTVALALAGAAAAAGQMAPDGHPEGLTQFALELVNEDRQKHGADPVVLGSNGAAQAHADDLFAHDYLSHWSTDGVKPYVTYTRLGGQGYVSENIAQTKWYCRHLQCTPNQVDPFGEVRGHHHSMVYDDAHADWGHRDTILEPAHTHVNFGFAYDEDAFYFVQHFESNLIKWRHFEMVHGYLSLNGHIPEGYDLSHISIYRDPEPEPLTADTLESQPPYDANHYGLGRLAGVLLEPPGRGYGYIECHAGMVRVELGGSTECVRYSTFIERTDEPGRMSIFVDTSKWTNDDGLHTMVVYLEDADGRLVSASSATLEYVGAWRPR